MELRFPQMPRSAIPWETRFWVKVNKNGPIPAHRPDLGPCWLWTAALNYGYGVFCRTGSKTEGAHRISLELAGKLPPSPLVPDHLCRVRACVNPDHMEPVTRGANVLRGEGISVRNALVTHCPAGHPYTAENTRHYKTPIGRGRKCRTCHREWERARQGAQRKAG